MNLSRIDHDTPIGRLSLVADGAALVGLYLPNHAPAPVAPDGAAEPLHDGPTSGLLDRARVELDEYFAGRRTTFDLPLAPHGTAFQRVVWDALLAIPFGKTQSYGGLAAAIGRPSASRAVGAANGHNPISIVIPCHRVIGADGSLTGYGGGMACKEWLLSHEGALPGRLLA
jgi:methylated-DNA-[protein]-cysteine S-methyltransferase